jgi:hypothetical protein
MHAVVWLSRFLAVIATTDADLNNTIANVTHMEITHGLTTLIVQVHNAGDAPFNDDLSLVFECTPGQSTPVEFTPSLANLAPGGTSVLTINENLCHCGRGAAVRLHSGSAVTLSNAEADETTGRLLITPVPYSSCLDGSSNRGSEPPFVWDVDRSGEINTSQAPLGIVRGDRGLPVTQYSIGRNGVVVNIYGGKGKMPHYQGTEAINGGLPQLGSLEEHLDRYKISLNALILDPDFEVSNLSVGYEVNFLNSTFSTTRDIACSISSTGGRTGTAPAAATRPSLSKQRGATPR